MKTVESTDPVPDVPFPLRLMSPKARPFGVKIRRTPLPISPPQAALPTLHLEINF